MLLYKSVVSVRSLDGEHIYGATPDEARSYVERGLAVALGEGKAFVGKIQLTLSLSALREEFRPREKATGRPKPPLRPPMSSTGDAGRGNTMLGRYRVVRLERQAALR